MTNKIASGRFSFFSLRRVEAFALMLKLKKFWTNRIYVISSPPLQTKVHKLWNTWENVLSVCINVRSETHVLKLKKKKELFFFKCNINPNAKHVLIYGNYWNASVLWLYSFSSLNTYLFMTPNILIETVGKLCTKSWSWFFYFHDLNQMIQKINKNIIV